MKWFHAIFPFPVTGNAVESFDSLGWKLNGLFGDVKKPRSVGQTFPSGGADIRFAVGQTFLSASRSTRLANAHGIECRGRQECLPHPEGIQQRNSMRSKKSEKE